MQHSCVVIAAFSGGHRRNYNGHRYMTFVDMNRLKPIDRLPGWKGRDFHAAGMTYAHYEFAAVHLANFARSTGKL